MTKTQPNAIDQTSDHKLKFTARVGRINISSTAAVLMEAEVMRAKGVDVIDFGPGEPDFPTPENIKAAARKALEENFTKYTSTAGILPLREAVAERHRQDFGSDYAPQEVIVCVGGKQAIFNAIASIVEFGDEVIVPVPYWVTFADVIQYHGGKIVFVEAREENEFQLLAQEVEKAMTPKTKLIIINSPNNPSGAIMDENEFRKVAELAIQRDVYLMTDEAYVYFVYDDRKPFSIASLSAEIKNRLIVVGTLSKTYAMTGWRIGYAMAPQHLIQQMLKIQSHSTSNPTSISQKAAIEALRGPQSSVPPMLAEYARRRACILDAMKKIPSVRCRKPQGAFYVYPNVSAFFGRNGIQTSTDFAKALLKEAQLVVVPGEAFGTRDHVRFSYALSMEQLQHGMERFEKFCKTLP